ncbi:unnamed protein product, partial [Adineta steineri]
MTITSYLLLYIVGSLVLSRSNAIQWPKPITYSSSSSAQVISDLISRVLDNAPSAKLFQVSIQPDLAVNGKDVFVLSNGSTSGS